MDKPDYPKADISSSSLFITSLLLLGALIYYLSYIRYGLVHIDEGVTLDQAERLMRGQEWYVDYFSLYGPLRSWPLSKLFVFTGTSFIWYRLYFVVVRLVGLGFMIAVGRRLLPLKWLVPAILPAILIPSHIYKSLMLLLPMMFLWLIFRMMESRRLLWPVLLGAWAGLSFWIRFEIIFVLVVISIVGIEYDNIARKHGGREKWNRRGALVLGIAIGFGVPALFFPGISEFVKSFLRFAGEKKAPPVGILWPTWSMIRSDVHQAVRFIYIWTILFVYAGVAAALVWNIRRALRPALWSYRFMVLMVGTGFLYSAILQSNLPHLIQVSSPVYLLLMDAGYSTGKRAGKQWIKTAAPAIIALYFTGFIVYGLFFASLPAVGGIGLRRMMTVPVHSPLGTVYFHSPMAEHIQSVVDYIRATTKDDDPVTVVPDAILVPVMARRSSSLMSLYLYPGLFKYLGPQDRIKVTESFLRAELIIYFERPTRLEHPRPESFRLLYTFPQLYELILENYTLEKIIGDYVVLRKGKDTSGATRVFMEGWEAYKYGRLEDARLYFEDALQMGGPAKDITPLLDDVRRRLSP